VLGIPQAVRLLDFEKQVVVDGQTKFIDAYIKPTKILIEQKGASIDLNKKYKQSGGAMLTPFEQAKRYAADLGKNLYPNYIVVCNFKEFEIHDMSDPNAEPVVIKLEDLPTQVHRLAFLADVDKEVTAFEQQISVDAGVIVGEIYDALLAQYSNPSNPESLKSLNKLCVRLVFCLYAEDSGLFSTHLEFHDYLRKYSADARTALIQLFKILNTPEDKRDQYLADDLLAFPYVNGGLFADEDIEIPRITPEIVELILKRASEGFDWSLISPTIFGAVFESTLNPETRRKGGMHYTSIENIHKVIDPLFLNELKEKLKACLMLKVPATRKKRLEEFRMSLGKLTFLDPACGSGNFLTETYKCLRELENEALRAIYHGQMALGEGLSPITVHIDHFYGIEINDFAVTVARTALWIAESQMMKETEDIVGQELDFLPLKSSAHIHEGNALRIDWEKVVPSFTLDYIIGNPPFVGTKFQTPSQKQDVLALAPELKPTDYVSCWFFKSALICQNKFTRAALVATNSITQSEQVYPIWNLLFSLGMHIDFAYRTFVWTSEATSNAHVHCVIIGFSAIPTKQKLLFLPDGQTLSCENISPYLFNGNNSLLQSRNTPIDPSAPKMSKGSAPVDGGYFLVTPDEKEQLVQQNPALNKYIKRYMGAVDLIQGKERFCLWLKNCTDSNVLKDPRVMQRIKGVKESRLSSPKKSTQKWAEKPTLFMEDRQPDSDYLILPVVSSEAREYLPICYVSKDVIANTNAQMLPNASLYDFGIISSKLHMAWIKTVCGRMKSDLAYSVKIVYNNFPWPSPDKQQIKNIANTAKAILDTRDKYSDKSLAELYDPLTMPVDLREAHNENDRAVLKAYGFKPSMSESEIVAELFKLYETRTKELEQEEDKKKQEKGSKKK